MNLGQACRPCRGSCTPIPGRGCFGDLPGDEIVESPPSLNVEPLILAHAKDQATMDRFAAELGQKFKLKDMGDAGYYMGCHITRNRKACELKLDQHLYVESTVKRFDVNKATKIPAASGVPTLSKADELRNPEGKEEMRKFPYREAVGVLMWTATMTRPHIACAVRAVARFCENPGPAHKKGVMKILQYLLHTK